MNRLVFHMIVAATLCLGLIACDGTTEPAEIDYFPNKPGTSWTYVLDHSLRDKIDTVTVSVTGTMNIPDGQAMVWRRSYTDGTADSLFVRTTGDTVQFYTHEPDGTWLRRDRLVLPLTVGKQWRQGTDSSAVVEQRGVALPRQTMQDVYHVERNFNTTGGSFGLIHLWFVPKIGLVKIERTERITGPLSLENWQLISYTVK